MIPQNKNNMSQTAMTVRLDSQMKSRFDLLCGEFGMSANTAINIFVNAVVRSNSIPFPINAPDYKDKVRERALAAYDSINKRAAESSQPDMSLEEINEEISHAREERKKKIGA